MRPRGWPGRTSHTGIAAWATALLALASAGCGNQERPQPVEAAALDDATRATEVPSTAPTIPSTTTEPLTTVPPATTAPPLPTAPDLVPEACTVPDPEALQRAVDEGHQPWRGDPVSVVYSCVAGAFDWAEPAIEQLDSNTYRATDPSSGDAATVAVTRPFPEATIWVIESVTR